MSYFYPNVGAFYHDSDKTSFVVWAPLADVVEVVVDKRAFPMKKDERGYWSVTREPVRPGARYRFRLDGGDALPDPASLFQPDGVHGDSEVVDRHFVWSDHEWKGLDPRDMILYELHTGTFTARGDFDGIREKFAHLRELGINTIELMPVAQFPGTRNWGYDGVFPFAVQSSYGGAQGLKNLINAAHGEGIAVVLDVVYNHLGPEGNYLGAYGPYFTPKYRNFWGESLNFDDAWCDGVRHFYWQNALMWLDEFHIDGLRLDAVHAIWDFSAVHFISELSAKVRALEEKTGRRKVLIAEIDLNNPRYIATPEKGGYGLDAQWIDEFHHALRALVTGQRDGYYEDFGTPDHLRKALRDSYVFTGEYSVHRKKTFGTSATDHPYDQFVVFGQNHDQVGNRLLGDRLSTLVSFEGLKLVAGAVLLSPHIPMLFMGEEFGEKNPFQYFISHTDEELVNAVREGRKREFSYFNWKGEVPDPQSPDTFRACVLSWRDDAEARALFSFYRELITFRKNRIAMRGTSRSSIQVYPDTGNVVLYQRVYEGDRIFITLNFEKSDIRFQLPESGRRIFDSASAKWNGPGKEPDDTREHDQLLYPESIAIFEC